MKLKTGDNVVIIASKDKGKNGKIIKTLKNDNKVVVEGVNIVKKHVKPNQLNQTGSIQEVEAPIDASNVMILDPKTKVPTRIGYTVNEKGVKVRVTKKSGTILD